MFIYLRNNTLSREELNDEDGFAQSIHYGDVLIKYGECLNVSKELLPYIDNKNIVNKFKKFYIQNGDVIIADTAEDETVGKCIEISGIVDHNIISGLHTIPLRPVNKFAYGYLGFYLNSNSYHNQLKPLMQGIKVTSISKNLFKTTTLNYPSNIQEQKIIGRYFDALNHLITLHQRKLEKLKIIKKSMLENLFPQNGEKTPKIRFSGFTEDWEQRKLGECFTERIESMPNGELISVTINDGIKKFSELGRHDNSNDDKSKYKKVCVGDIAYNSMRMWQGASGYSPYEGIVSPAYTVLAANHGVNSRCIAHQFKLSKMIHTFKINSQGITSDNWNLKFTALSDIPIYISKQIDEQCKIAFFLETLDHLITLHQSKLDKLQKIKKSMLESMFV